MATSTQFLRYFSTSSFIQASRQSVLHDILGFTIQGCPQIFVQQNFVPNSQRYLFTLSPYIHALNFQLDLGNLKDVSNMEDRSNRGRSICRCGGYIYDCSHHGFEGTSQSVDGQVSG
jgi:hypothetical protein